MKNRIVGLIVTILFVVTIGTAYCDFSFAEDVADDEGSALQEMASGEIEKDIAFLYIENPKIEAPGIQNIAVSWNKDINQIDKMTLIYEDSGGKQFDLEEKDRTEKTVLFTREFLAQEVGLYSVKGIKYFDGQTEQYFAFDDVEMAPDFEIVDEVKNEAAETNIAVVEMEDKAVNASDVQAQVQDALEDADIDVAAGSRSRTTQGNVIVVLDPGHGGSDVGATREGLYERDLNLKIAQACYNELVQYGGVKVYMTRNDNSSSNLSLAERAAYAANRNADVLVSIHINSGGGTGAEVWTPNSSYNSQIYTEGKGLGRNIISELEKLGLYNRGVKEKNSANGTRYADGSIADFYGIIRESKKRGVTGIIIEHAFIDNASDRAFLSNDSNLKKIGNADAAGIAKYFNLSKGTWVQDSNGYRYKLGNGTYLKSCFREIGEDTYYFDKEGYRVTGIQKIDGNKYYFTKDGKLVKYEWIESGGKQYFASKSGTLRTGFATIAGSRYYFNQEGELQKLTGLQTIDGKRYYFNNDSTICVSQWLEFNGSRHFADESGAFCTGVALADGKSYYFNEKGEMQKLVGFQAINGSRYHFNDDSSVSVYQWIESGGKKYFASKSGTLRTGKAVIAGSTYLFDENGVLQDGIQTIDGEKYYLDPNTGEMAIYQWIESGGNKYFASKSGTLRKGKAIIGGSTYLFDKACVLQYGVQTIDGDKYFFDLNTGEMAVYQWVEQNGHKYFASKSGTLRKGKAIIGGSTYLFNDQNELEEYAGFVWIDKDRYYFFEDHSMAVYQWITMNNTGKKYFASKSGTLRIGYAAIAGYYYYFNENGVMQTGYIKVNGEERYFDVNTGKELKGTPIMGSSQVSAYDLRAYYEKYSPIAYPSLDYKDAGAPTLLDFCQIYCNEAAKEGIRAEVAFCQAMKETGWLQYKGDVSRKQYNFAGIGATGGGVKGASFDNVTIGVRAQIQHLKAYATTAGLNQACVDPRYHLVTPKGVAPYVEWLGAGANPAGKGWAPGATYGTSIVSMMKTIK